MKRRLLWLFLLMFLLVGCNKTTEVVTTTGGSINTQEEMGLIELRVFDGNIQWKYDFENTWTDLVALSTLTGPTGEDGKAVMFRLNEGYIQWQREGDSTWNSLFDIASLQGLGIESMQINELGELVITYTDDSVANLGELNKLNIVQFTDGYGNTIAVHLVRDGGTAIPPIAPVMPGHTFIGWSQSYTNIMQETSINALYEVNTYTITYNPNGGDTIEGDVYNYGEAVTLPIPVRFGYRFMGWFMGDTANSPKATDGMLLRNDLTLYARWQKETAVTVTNEEELRSAIADYSVEEIIFANDITVNQNIFISHSLKIDGNNHKLLSENFYELFIITNENGGFDSELLPPSGGYLEILDLEIICDTGIPGFVPYSVFLFEQVYNMDIRFDNISVQGFAEEGVIFIESGDIDFTLVDSFFDVTYSGIGGFMNEGMNFYIVNSTFRSNVGIYLGEYSFSNFIVTDSDFYIESLDEEGGAAIADFASAYNFYRFTNSNFYIEGDYISSIVRSMFESEMQSFEFEDCYFETNNPYYEDLFYHEWLTEHWMHNNTLAFKEGITDLDDSSYANNSSAKIILPESLETIGNNAFSNNTNLISIIIPEGVISIGAYAFSSCYMLTSVIIPQSVTYIGDDAFVDSLATIFITSGTDTSMYDSNWDGDLGVMGIVDSGKVDGLTYVVYEETGELNAIIIDFDGEEEDVVIPKTIDVESVPANVKAIHEYAFANQFLTQLKR